MERGVSVTVELSNWGFDPTGFCYCGCREETGGHFAPGHDAYFAPRLLRVLRGNRQVSDAIRRLIAGG